MVKSEIMGRFMGPRPPSERGFLVYSLWVNWESMEQPISWQPIDSNSADLSLNWHISVGHTKVKSRGQKKRTTYLPKREGKAQKRG